MTEPAASTASTTAAAGPLLILQQPPYAGSFARAALDVAMSYAVFAQAPTLLFTGSGVLALCDSQAPQALGRKSLRKVIDSLPLYDVGTIYVDQSSLERAGLGAETLPDFARVIDAAQLRALRARAEHIVSL